MAKDPHHEVTRIRKRIATLQGELEELRLGRLTAAEARERLHQWVDQQAAKVDVTPLVVDATLETEMIDDRALSAAADGILTTSTGGRMTQADVKLAPYLCWLDPERMKQRLAESLERLGDVCSEIPASERARAKDAKEAELLELEREEERIIAAAEAVGTTIPRRPDANPAIILERAA
jgi:hypothetical protein